MLRTFAVACLALVAASSALADPAPPSYADYDKAFVANTKDRFKMASESGMDRWDVPFQYPVGTSNALRVRMRMTSARGGSSYAFIPLCQILFRDHMSDGSTKIGDRSDYMLYLGSAPVPDSGRLAVRLSEAGTIHGVHFKPMETGDARLYVSTLSHYDESDAAELQHLLPMGDWVTMLLYWTDAGTLTVAVDGVGVRAYSSPVAIKTIAFASALASCEWDSLQFGTIGGGATAQPSH